MMSRYSPTPDGVLDLDRSSGRGLANKRADLVDEEEFTDRAETRAGYRELDTAVENNPRGLSRAQGDRERAVPRDTVAELGHPQMLRPLLGDGELRTVLSSRQRKARSVDKRQAQDAMTLTEHRAVQSLITEQDVWHDTNEALSTVVGDAQELDEVTRTRVQRLDRSIQHYEETNRRGHVIYANVELPPDVLGARKPEKFINEHLPPEITFDRYTGAAHCLHEIESDQQTKYALEIQTRRGIYLGRSDSLDDTTHVLPRGIRLKPVGMRHAPYQRPDGTDGYRRVIQLVDVDDDLAEQ